MSVANLEAFALAQGIDKAFDKMSQGEQVMLRYQYLMQATSDAQGDFARTSDGFANSLRLLQNNFESLKTMIGGPLLEVINNAMGHVNELLSGLVGTERPRTVLDEIADINLDTETKLEQIKETKQKADDLIDILRDIEAATVTDKSGVISAIASGANELATDAGTRWDKFIDGLDGLGTVITSSENGTEAGNDLKGLASGGDAVTGTKGTFKYADLPEGIKELIDNATGGKKAGEEIAGLTEADKVAGEKKTFKFSGFGKEAKEIIDNVDGGKTAGEQIAGLSEAEKVAGSKETFKFSGFGKEAKEVIDNVDGGKTAGEQIAGLSEADKVAGEKQTFKFSGFGKEAKEVIDNVDGGKTAGEQIAGLAEAEKVSGEKQTFKFSGFGADAKEVIDNASGGTEAGKQLSGLANGAEKVAGNTEQKFTFKALGENDGVGKLIEEADGGTDAGTNLTDLAKGASEMTKIQYSSNGAIAQLAGDIEILDSTSTRNWSSIFDVFKRVPGISKNLDDSKIKKLSESLSGLDGDKVTAWQDLMGILGEDIPALSELTGQDENTTAAWLEAMKEAANGLSNEDVNSWNALLSLLAEGTPGAGNFLTSEDMANVAKAAGMSDDIIKKLGDSSTDTDEKQKLWIKTCKELVQILPELNEIINTETGEIKGGIEAIQKYADEWEESNRRIILSEALKKKEQAVLSKVVELGDYELEYLKAYKAREKFEKENADLAENYRKKGILWLNEEIRDGNRLAKTYRDLVFGVDDTRKAYQEQSEGVNEAKKELEQYRDAAENAVDGMKSGKVEVKEFGEEAKTAATDGIESLTTALKDMNDYVERTRDSTKSSIDSALSGFKSFETAEAYFTRLREEAGNEAAKIQEEINKATKDGKGTIELEMKLTGVEDNIPTLEKLKTTFEDNLTFIQEYQKNLEDAKKKGASDEFLAEFADFSQENAAYLHLLSQASDKEVKAVSDAYDDMAAAKKPLTDSLTEIKLKADEEFNELVAKAKQAAIDLNNGDIAKESMASTVQGIVDGIQEHVKDVGDAVDALNAELARLGETNGLNIYGGLNGSGISLTFGTGEKVGSHANGLDYVPFNNYLSYLHEGEAVLTAEEAAVWRNFKNGGSGVANTIDYGQLSGAIWENAPNMGGNVYLDGRTVGRVISAQQANSYRALERSGWQG